MTFLPLSKSPYYKFLLRIIEIKLDFQKTKWFKNRIHEKMQISKIKQIIRSSYLKVVVMVKFYFENPHLPAIFIFSRITYFNFKRFQKTMSMLIFSLDQPLTINQKLNFIVFCHYSKKMARPLLFWNCKTNKTVETEIYWLFVIWFLVTGCFNERNKYKIIKQMFSKLNFHNLASNFECLFWLFSSSCH